MLLPLLFLPALFQVKAPPPKPAILEFLSAGLTFGPGIQPMDGKVDPEFPYFSGGVVWRGKGRPTKGEIRLHLVDPSDGVQPRVRRLPLKGWEPADPMNPEQWRWKSAWPGGDAEGRTVRISIIRRGRLLAKAEGPVRSISLPAAMPAPK